MGGVEKLSGPDLSEGVSIGDLADGAMVQGHADGEAVLLARSGDELFAIGATCSHYGGPLAEGALVGDMVRCPWHHACFSLRTGEALRAPALNPVAVWQVKRDGDRVRVEGKEVAEALAPVRGVSERRAPVAPSGATPSIVIIGAGAAGSAAAEMSRRMGFEGRVTLLDGEENAPYDRPNLSKDYLAGSAPEEWIPLRSPESYREHGIELVRRARVTSIDVPQRRVMLEDGSSHGWNRLLLATGAEPVRPPVEGAELPHVFTLRSLDDSRAIIARAGMAKRAVVIGASFIGLEVAASLRARELEVHVVAPEERPLEKVMGAEVGDFIRGLHEEHGVVFHLGQTARQIDREGVVLQSGQRIGADLVVVGVGVRPRLELAERAGLAMDRGVAVNAELETSVPGVFAAGDIARWPEPRSGERIRVEHWVVAQRQGQTAARNMVNGLWRRTAETFDGVPFFWSQHYDLSLNYVGHAERWDRVEISGRLADRDCALTYMLDGKAMAVVTLFRDRASLAAEMAMESESVAC